MVNEKCLNCGCSIGNLETPFVWNDRIVCRPCFSKLQSKTGGKVRFIAIACAASIAVVAGGTIFLLKSRTLGNAATGSARSTPTQDRSHTDSPRVDFQNPPSTDDANDAASRGNAENNNRLKSTGAATANPVPRSTPVFGKLSGAAWAVRNDGSSNLMRGIPVTILERETTEVPKLIDVLQTMKGGWEGWAKYYGKSADDKKTEAMNSGLSDGGTTMRKYADRDTEDAATATAKAVEIQKVIDSLSGKATVDRLLAFGLEKRAVELDKPLSDGGTTMNVNALPEVLIGRGPSAADFGSVKTNVDGKFVIDNVPPGDYYVVSAFESGTLILEWVVPIHVTANHETVLDLDNDNATFLRQRR